MLVFHGKVILEAVCDVEKLSRRLFSRFILKKCISGGKNIFEEMFLPLPWKQIL